MLGSARPIPRALVVGVLVSGVIACTRSAQPEPRASGAEALESRDADIADSRASGPSAAGASAAPSTSVAKADSGAAPAPPASFVAWTDPAAIAALAADCHPEKPGWDYDKHDSHEDPLSCTLLFEQSCSYDPCVNRLQGCREGCSKTCKTCDERCGKTCDDCAAKCTSAPAGAAQDTCRLACAKTTGACKQACVTAIDRCATGTCAAAMSPCYVNEKAAWRAHGCSCKKIAPCTEPCLGSGDKMAACLAACRAKFPGCDTGYCIMGTDPTAEQ